MGERQESGPYCSRCGAKSYGNGCPVCGSGDGDSQTRQMVALPGDDAPTPPAEVPLVREIKGVAVKDPPSAPSGLEQLAARSATPASADDGAANLLAGPGYRRRAFAVPWRWLLWLLVLAACLLLWR